MVLGTEIGCNELKLASMESKSKGVWNKVLDGMILNLGQCGIKIFCGTEAKSGCNAININEMEWKSGWYGIKVWVLWNQNSMWDRIEI